VEGSEIFFGRVRVSFHHFGIDPSLWAGMVLLTVYICIKVQVDLQADKSSVVVKGPFFPQV
jgi:hypothetical protein